MGSGKERDSEKILVLGLLPGPTYGAGNDPRKALSRPVSDDRWEWEWLIRED